MSAYVEAQMAQYRDRAYTTHGNFTRSLLAEVAHEQKARPPPSAALAGAPVGGTTAHPWGGPQAGGFGRRNIPVTN